MNLDHLIICKEPKHTCGYSCARCNRVYCVDCDHASDVETIKTMVRYCPDWRCQREEKIEGSGLVVDLSKFRKIHRAAEKLLQGDAPAATGYDIARELCALVEK